VVTASSVHDTSHAKLAINLPLPVNVGSIAVGQLTGIDFTCTHFTMVQSSIMAYSSSSIGCQCLNTVVWGIAENEAEQRGIKMFRGTVVVQLPLNSTEDSVLSRFYARFTVKANQASKTRQLLVAIIEKFGEEDKLPRFDS
jgi:hypothetical protein